MTAQRKALLIGFSHLAVLRGSTEREFNDLRGVFKRKEIRFLAESTTEGKNRHTNTMRSTPTTMTG
ncbi:MAG: hypothetical protein LBH96_04415 [Candidatus Peribacteria bacterium]|nr:hypothetical protein [Candidatus Peribacteria bacterium]